nr:helix-turn-helix domain-containing protein [Paenibacillus hamazuiensis]
MKDQKKAEVIAAEREQLLSPLLAERLDPAKTREIKARIYEQTGLSERTLRRYLAKYREEGFGGLKPKGKGRQPSEATIPPEVLEQAIPLRREVPGRSVAQLIQILEWEGRIQPGEIKRSTLQERLAKRGYSTRHMRMYAESGVAARRFQQRHRNRLWHSDLKYGPYLPIGPGGAMKQVFLVTFIDEPRGSFCMASSIRSWTRQLSRIAFVGPSRSSAFRSRFTSTTASNTEPNG